MHLIARRGFLEGCGPLASRTGTKNKTKAIDRNLSSTLIRPHQGHTERERKSKKERRRGREKEKWEKRRHRRARPKKDKTVNRYGGERRTKCAKEGKQEGESRKRGRVGIDTAREKGQLVL